MRSELLGSSAFNYSQNQLIYSQLFEINDTYSLCSLKRNAFITKLSNPNTNVTIHRYEPKSHSTIKAMQKLPYPPTQVPSLKHDQNIIASAKIPAIKVTPPSFIEEAELSCVPSKPGKVYVCLFSLLLSDRGPKPIAPPLSPAWIPASPGPVRICVPSEPLNWRLLLVLSPLI